MRPTTVNAVAVGPATVRTVIKTALALLLSALLGVSPIAGLGASSPTSGTVVGLRGLGVLPTARVSQKISTRVSQSTPCYNNVCPSTTDPLTYHGGPVITHPSVYVVVFSDSLTTTSPAAGLATGVLSPAAPNVPGAIDAAIAGPTPKWWMTEYSPPSGTIEPGSYVATVALYNPALADNASVTNNEIVSALTGAIQSGQLSNSPNAIFALFLRSGQSVALTPGSPGYCAFHAAAQYLAPGGASFLNYLVMPNQSGLASCAYAGPTASDFQNTSAVLSHELIETVTDPLGTGWFAGASAEIADICVASGDVDAVPYDGQTYMEQRIYSSAARGCFGLPAATSITAVVGSGSLTAAIGSSAGPVSGQTATASAGAWTSQLTTDSLGLATVSVPTSLTGPVTITFPTVGPLIGSSTEIASNPPFTIGVSGPVTFTGSPSGSVSITFVTAPATSGVPVAVIDPRTGLTLFSAPTTPEGVVHATFTPPTDAVTVVARATPTGTQPVFSSPVALTAIAQAELTLTPIDAQTVAISLTLSGRPLPGAVTVSCGSWSVVVPVGPTGLVNVAIPTGPTAGPLITATYAGTSLVSPMSVTIARPYPVHVVLRVLPAHPRSSAHTIIVRVSPAVRGDWVTLSGSFHQVRARTDLSGVARLVVHSTSTRLRLLVTVVIGPRRVRTTMVVRLV